MTAPAVKNGAGTVVAVHLRAGDGEPVRIVLEKNVFPVRQPERNHSRPIINGDDGLDKAVGEAQASYPKRRSVLPLSQWTRKPSS